MQGKILIGLIFMLTACVDESIISEQEQLKRDVQAIDDYLAANNITNAIADVSGVRMVITHVGTVGLPPAFGNKLKINYTGKLLSTGAVFGSGTWLENLEETIYGWQICLPMLPEGSVATLYIPSTFAYGSQGNGSIPPNTNLIFDVDILEVDLTTQQQTKLTSDGLAIDNYLASKGTVTATTHSSGLRYEILTPGTGTTPGLYDQIKIAYTGKIIKADNTEEEFGSGTIEPSLSNSCRVVNFVQGWHVGLPLLKEGGKIRMYVPSGLAYGNIIQGNIPANSNLFFEVELIDVIE